MVMLLGIDQSFSDLKSMVSVSGEALDNDVHDDGLHRRETHEYLLNNLGCDVLEVAVCLVH